MVFMFNLLLNTFAYLTNDILLRGILLPCSLDEPFTGVTALLSGVVTTTPFSQSPVVIWLAVQTSGELQYEVKQLSQWDGGSL